MVSWKDLSPEERLTVQRLREPQALTTANGSTYAYYSVWVPVLELQNHQVQALILDNTTCLISLGRLCLVDGFTCNWAAGQKPTLRHANGTYVECEYSHNVPLLYPVVNPTISPTSCTTSTTPSSARGDSKQKAEVKPKIAAPSQGSTESAGGDSRQVSAGGDSGQISAGGDSKQESADVVMNRLTTL